MLMIYELKNNLESAYMVHECRMQGAGDPSYYDRVPKLKQSMCGGIGHMSGATPDHMHTYTTN